MMEKSDKILLKLEFKVKNFLAFFGKRAFEKNNEGS